MTLISYKNKNLILLIVFFCVAFFLSNITYSGIIPLELQIECYPAFMCGIVVGMGLIWLKVIKKDLLFTINPIFSLLLLVLLFVLSFPHSRGNKLGFNPMLLFSRTSYINFSGSIKIFPVAGFLSEFLLGIFLLLSAASLINMFCKKDYKRFLRINSVSFIYILIPICCGYLDTAAVNIFNLYSRNANRMPQLMSAILHPAVLWYGVLFVFSAIIMWLIIDKSAVSAIHGIIFPILVILIGIFNVYIEVLNAHLKLDIALIQNSFGVDCYALALSMGALFSVWLKGNIAERKIKQTPISQ